MIQRSATCVFSMNAHEAIAMANFVEEDGIPRYSLDDLDLASGLHSMPPPFLMQMAEQRITALYKAIDKEMHENLEKAGFKLTWSLYPGGPEVGPVGLLVENLAAGTSMCLSSCTLEPLLTNFSPGRWHRPDDH